MRKHTISLILVLSAMQVFADTAPVEVSPGEIAGTVTNEEGRPIEGARVEDWAWNRNKATTTDRDGHFHLKKLDKGQKIELRISKEGFSPAYEEQGAGGISDLKVVLNNKTYLEGTVYSPDGKPVPDALVRADCGPKVADQLHILNVWTETRSDADGHYKLYVAPDSYKIQTRIPNTGLAYLRASVDAGQAVAQDIHLEPGVRLVVKCVDGDTGVGVPGVALRVPRQKNMVATTDANGHAVFEHMPADTFEFEVSSEAHVKSWSAESTNPRMRERPRNLDLRWEDIAFQLAPDMEPVTIQLEKGITLSGHVVDPEGNPVAGATIATARYAWGDAIDMTKRFTARTNAQGAFSIILPASGDDRYSLIAHDGDYGKWRKWANGVTEPLHTVPGENKEDVTIKLTAPATIKGQVVDKGGNPVPDKWVRVMSADDRDSRYTAPDAHTDKDGNFEMKFVRPGDVLVQVEPFLMRTENDPRPSITSVSVTVGENELKQGVSLTVSVSGRPHFNP
jgi:protocatechuate 3,4-dioxygenase beta subunit